MGTNIRVEFVGIRKKKEGKRGSKQKTEKESDKEGDRNKNRDFPGIPTVKSRWFESKSRSTHHGYAWVPIS